MTLDCGPGPPEAFILVPSGSDEDNDDGDDDDDVNLYFLHHILLFHNKILSHERKHPSEATSC